MQKEGKMENNSNTVLEITSQKVFYELTKNLGAENPFKDPSICYILRNNEISEHVYRISSGYLEEDMPKNCQVVESKKVAVECYYNGRWGYWMFSPILKKASKNSGFSSVDRWLDKWSKTKGNFEYNKRYNLWLLKLKYPVKKEEKQIVA